MVRLVMSLLFVLYVCGLCVGQRQTPSKSIAQVHDIARTVTVSIDTDTGHGSGVWLDEGIVVTCWHVVANAHDIKVSIGSGDVITLGSSTFEGVFIADSATVLEHDEESDVAILKTTHNPFKSTSSLIKTPKQEIKPRLAIAKLKETLPVAGTLTVLSGYPMKGLDLISQTGNAAGTGMLPMNPMIGTIKHPTNAFRLLVSVVANPGDSGGPVLDDHGDLIGILEGNLPSPVKDEIQKQARYVRVKRDAEGNMLTDDKGNPQLEEVAMTQNSGISLVIPTRLIVPLFKKSQAIR